MHAQFYSAKRATTSGKGSHHQVVMVEKKQCVAMRLRTSGESNENPVVVYAQEIYDNEMVNKTKQEQDRVRGRPYCCSHGGTLVLAAGKIRRPYFRHKCEGVTSATNSSAVESGNNGCGCSEDHLEAQRLLVKHINNVKVETWKACKCHYAAPWQVGAPSHARLEKSDVYNGKRVRYDVVVYDDATRERVKVIEVMKTSKTDQETRPVGSLEVRTTDVIIAADRYDKHNHGFVLHNLFVDKTHCQQCEEERKRAADAAVRKAEQEARIERKRKASEARMLEEMAQRRLEDEAIAQRAALLASEREAKRIEETDRKRKVDDERKRVAAEFKKEMQARWDAEERQGKAETLQQQQQEETNERAVEAERMRVRDLRVMEERRLVKKKGLNSRPVAAIEKIPGKKRVKMCSSAIDSMKKQRSLMDMW